MLDHLYSDEAIRTMFMQLKRIAEKKYRLIHHVNNIFEYKEESKVKRRLKSVIFFMVFASSSIAGDNGYNTGLPREPF